MEPSNLLMRRVDSIKKLDGSIAQRDRNRILIRTKLNRQNNTLTINRLFQGHGLRVIYPDNLHVLLIENHFINLLEVEDLLDIVIVLRFVFDLGALDIAHVCVGTLVSYVYLVLNQIGCELLEFQQFRACFFTSVEEVHQLLHEVISVGQAGRSEHLFHDLHEFF